VINNAVWYNRNIVLKSGADGTYRYALPATDAWYVRGTTNVEYNGRTYTVELKPDFTAAFPGTEGRVVNLRWVMTGEKSTDYGGGGFYGGTVAITASWGLSDLKGVTITLTPVGTLLDGSAGAELVRTVSEVRGNVELNDLPMGRYIVRATRNGTPLRIQMRYSIEYLSSVTADFEPAYSGASVYGIYFAVSVTDSPE
jgi:hypothetical protein